MTPLLRYRWFRTSALLAVFLSCFSVARAEVLAQEDPSYTGRQLEDATRLLRDHYYNRAWALGSMLGEEWEGKAPGAAELQAWYALNLARDGSVDDALSMAEDLLERSPEDPWSWFALAGTVFRHRERYGEALEACDKALSLKADDLDFFSLKGDIIRTQEGEEEAIAFVDGLPPELGQHPLIQIRKVVATHGLAGESDDPEDEEKAFEMFREVMAKDPTFLEPVFFLGTRLQSARRLDEAMPLLERSAALSPSYRVHESYWRGIQARRDLPEEEKLDLVEADIRSLLDRGGETPGALMAIARVHEGAQQTEKRDSIWSQVLAIYPESLSAEWVFVNQYRDLRRQMGEHQKETGEEDLELKAQYRRRLEEFLMRPVHHRESLRGDAFRGLLLLLKDDDMADPEFLYSVVRGVELYEGINIHIIYAQAPIALAEHGSHLAYAEELARKGTDAVAEQMEEVREMGIFKTEEEFQKSANAGKATMLDALGWVFFHQGRVDDAEGELLKAYQLNEESVTVLHHLGQLYEHRHALALEEGQGGGDEGFLDQAQEFFLKGSLVPTPGDNPNDEALEGLFRTRHGSLAGFEEYLAEASNMDSDARKEKILAERLEDPKAMEAFHLPTLLGDSLSSADLKGKVVVINFWGTWCGPCVIEMPEIQEVYDQYAGDEGVAILTLSNDQTVEVLHRFMEKEEYTYPVLLDDGYVRRVRVRAFPTTWFIDPDGDIRFEKRGWSEELAQEFSWRIEALRGR